MSADEKDIVFMVSSACSGCGSYLRAYSKDSRLTRCFDCGARKPHPNILSVFQYEEEMVGESKEHGTIFQNRRRCKECGSNKYFYIMENGVEKQRCDECEDLF